MTRFNTCSSLILLTYFTCIVFATDKPKLTLDDFFNAVDFPAVQISPDGHAVVLVAERADWDREIFQNDLWLYRDDGNVGSLTKLTEAGHESAPRWSPDGRWIAFLSERHSPSGKSPRAAGGEKGTKDAEEESKVGQLYLISPNGGEAFPVTSGDDAVHCFDWSPDSHTIYFATREPWNKEQKDAYKKIWKDTEQYRASERGDFVFALDLAGALERHADSGTKETSDSEKDSGAPPGARVVAETPFRIQQLEISPDGTRLAFVTTSVSEREEKLKEFEIYSVDLHATSPKTAPRQLTNNQALEQELTWAKDSRHLFFAVDYGSAEGNYCDCQKRIYWLDTDTGKLARWASSFEGAVMQHALLSDGRLLAAGRIGTQLQLYVQSDAAAAFSNRPGWPGSYETLSAARNSKRIAFVHSSLDRPMEVYLAEGPEQLEQARAITSFNRFLTERDLPKGKPYRWTTDDGTSVEGMLIYPPEKFEAKHLPMLTLIHGGPNDADGDRFEADWYQWDRMAATTGWLVFEPNYRGSTGYGDKFMLGIITQIVSRPGKDILAGVDALVKDGIADPAHLTVGGYSYGGYLTNWLITQTDRFRAAVTGAGAVENTANWGNDDTTLDDAYFLGGRPWEAVQRYAEQAAIYQIQKVHTPTHIVTGDGDIRVSALQAYLLDHALYSLDVPSTLLVFPGEGHSLDKNPWHGKIKVREELKWLQKYGGID